MKRKPRVYLASQCKIFDRVLSDGIVTLYCPLWSHFQHTIFPRPYEDWIAYDNEILPVFDACLRLNVQVGDYVVSESSGADGEVAQFEAMGKPVFYSLEDLYTWAEGISHELDTDSQRS
jgi:hypothetical protein